MDLQISDLLRIIKRRLLLIIIAAACALLITGIVSFYVLTPRYEATVTILVQPQNLGNQISYNDVVANEKLVPTYGVIIKSKKIARDVIKRLQLNISENELLKTIKVVGIKNSLITAITATHSDPVKATAIANSFAYSFCENLPEIMKVENVSILDVARLETNPKPVSPKPILNLLLVLLLVFNTGIGIAVLWEGLDRTVKSGERIKELLGVPVLATISRYPKKIKIIKHKQNEPESPLAVALRTLEKIKELLGAPGLAIISKYLKKEKNIHNKQDVIFCLDDPKSPIAEAFRTLRTNIRYMQFNKELSTLLVTSSLPKEGKTSIIVNLAVTMAQEGKKVLLMDCDLRKPYIHKFFNLPNEQGLTSLLIKQIDTEAAIAHNKQSYYHQSNLHILTSGPIPPNPSELLGAPEMARLVQSLKQHYDIILMDSAPVLLVTDGQLLAKLADAVLVVVKTGATLCENIKQTRSLLDHVGANLIGAIANYIDTKTSYYYNYF